MAQDAPAPRQERLEQGQQRIQQIQDRLQLTPEQTEQVRPILVEEMQALKALREKSQDGGNRPRARRKMAGELRDIQKQTDEKLKKILSSKQMDDLKKLREERRKDRRERAGRQ